MVQPNLIALVHVVRLFLFFLCVASVGIMNRILMSMSQLDWGKALPLISLIGSPGASVLLKTESELSSALFHLNTQSLKCL